MITTGQLDAATVFTLLVGISVMIVDRIIYRIWEPPAPAAHLAANALDTTPHTATRAAAIAACPTTDKATRPADAEADADAVAAAASTDASPARHARPLAPTLKLTLHVSLVLTLHAMVYFRLPAYDCSVACASEGGKTPCERSTALVFFYLFCSAYLLASARQIKHGLPHVQFEHPLSDASDPLSVYSYKVLSRTRHSLSLTLYAAAPSPTRTRDPALNLTLAC